MHEREFFHLIDRAEAGDADAIRGLLGYFIDKMAEAAKEHDRATVILYKYKFDDWVKRLKKIGLE